MELNSSVGDKVFVAWSGGKDSYLSLLRARDQGFDIVCLLSFVSADGESRSHGLKTEMLKQQAELLGIPLETEEVTWETYENGFERAVNRIKQERDVKGGVFGDINLDEHREWVIKMCTRCDVDYNLPLWHLEERKVTEELLAREGKAMVVAIRSDLVDQSWLGRIIDQEFIGYCLSKGISPCGEGGETHTLVVNGPLFRSPLQYRLGEIQNRENRALLEVYAETGKVRQ